MPLRIVSSFALATLVLAGSAAPQSAPPAGGQPEPNLSGAWVLNPALTERPQEVGFNQDWGGLGGGEEGGRSGGGRGGRGGTGAPRMSRQSVDDSTRVQQLTGEARTPPARLTIVQKTGSVAIADDQGHARTFHPDGRLEELTLGTVPLPTTARWDAGRLVVLFDVEQGRQLRYTFSPLTSPVRLLVAIRFLDRGREGDEVRLTYEPPGARESTLLSAPGAAPAPTAASPSAAPASAFPDQASADPRPRVLPPGSELRGLTMIGTVVESLSAQAAACGLDQAKLKTSVAKVLADAGFKTERFGNEETYVYVNILTSKMADGTCISRYDASLVTQADATFSYLKGLVSVQVQLLHEGGMAGGSPAVHASALMDALTKYVQGFVTQIRAANK